MGVCTGLLKVCCFHFYDRFMVRGNIDYLVPGRIPGQASIDVWKEPLKPFVGDITLCNGPSYDVDGKIDQLEDLSV